MKAPAFSFYVRDWLCSDNVEMMSGDAVKAYMYLLCKAWLQDPRGTLPSDDKSLALMARVSPEKWDEIKGEILVCFGVGKCKKHKGRLYSERLLEVSKISDIRSLSRKTKPPTKRTTKALRPAEDENEDEKESSSSLSSPDWKRDYSVYLEDVRNAYRGLIADREWIAERQRFHGNLDIKKTLEKAWKDYWATKAGWKNKKLKRAGELDWKRTANNALTQRVNQVWQERLKPGEVEVVEMTMEEAKAKGIF